MLDSGGVVARGSTAQASSGRLKGGEGEGEYERGTHPAQEGGGVHRVTAVFHSD